jgi:hypothetical protein
MKTNTCRILVLLLLSVALLKSHPCLAQDEYVDGGRQEQGMHACPPAYAMAGAHVSHNKFTCLRVVPPDLEHTVTSIVDHGTQGNYGRGDMHVCPAGMYMRGLHDGQNLLLCSRSPAVHLGPSSLDADGHTQGNGMHMCPDHRIMTGIHNGRNDFACAAH